MEQETVLELLTVMRIWCIVLLSVISALRRKRRTLCRLFFLNCWRAA